MSAQATLYVGTRSSARLLQANTGYTDDGNAYTASGHSERIAPEGPEGEVALVELVVNTRHFTSSATLTVQVLLDGVALPSQTVSLTGAATTTGIRTTHLLSLMQPYSADLGAGSAEQLRYAPRGTWVEVLISTGGVQLVVEDVVLGYDPVRSTMAVGDTR